MELKLEQRDQLKRDAGQAVTNRTNVIFVIMQSISNNGKRYLLHADSPAGVVMSTIEGRDTVKFSAKDILKFLN